MLLRLLPMPPFRPLLMMLFLFSPMTLRRLTLPTTFLLPGELLEAIRFRLMGTFLGASAPTPRPEAASSVAAAAAAALSDMHAQRRP